jgi:hypothetical protein
MPPSADTPPSRRSSRVAAAPERACQAATAHVGATAAHAAALPPPPSRYGDVRIIRATFTLLRLRFLGSVPRLAALMERRVWARLDLSRAGLAGLQRARHRTLWRCAAGAGGRRWTPRTASAAGGSYMRWSRARWRAARASPYAARCFKEARVPARRAGIGSGPWCARAHGSLTHWFGNCRTWADATIGRSLTCHGSRETVRCMRVCCAPSIVVLMLQCADSWRGGGAAGAAGRADGKPEQ